MFSISVNGGEAIKTEVQPEGQRFSASLNGKQLEGDFIRTGDRQYHLIYNNTSYRVTVMKLNAEEKSLVLRINGIKYNLQLRDKYDELLHRLGLDTAAAGKVNEIKAPMPGMVLNILVKEGDTVKKGDPLIVLEAMKMENILKSPGDGVIRKIAATKGSAVEKNQLLIQF